MRHRFVSSAQSASPLQGLLRRARARPQILLTLLLGGAIVLVFLASWAVAVTGLFGLTDQTDVAAVRQPPSIGWLASLLDQRPKRKGSLGLFDPVATKSDHILGTDAAGRDMFSLLVLGTRTYLGPGLLAVLIAVGAGTLLGALWGYYQGWIDVFAPWLTKTVTAIPKLLLLLVVGAVTDFNVYWIMTALGLGGIPKVAELIQARILSLKQAGFIEAAREAGLPDRAILGKHILWYQCRHLLTIQASFFMAEAILMETTLSYLNSGAQGLSWGRMVAHGSNDLFRGIYWTSVLPATAVVVTILGFYLLGDALNRLEST